MYSNFVRKSVWTHVVTCVYVCMLYCFHHQSECLGLCWPPNVFCRSPTMLQPYPDSAQVMDAPDLTSAVERGVYFNWLLEIVPGTVGNVYANQLILQADKRDARWPLVCRRRCVLCNVATRLVVYLAGSRRDPRVLRLARWSSRHRTRLYAPPAVPLLLERRCRVGRARQVAAAAEQRRPMEPRRSDLAAERSSPAVSASTVSSCEPERRTQLSFRRWRYRGRVRLFHGNAPQLFRLKAALEQFLFPLCFHSQSVLRQHACQKLTSTVM